MARRTPGLQDRSQFHGYWGRFQYSTSVPPATFAGRTGDVGSSLLPNVSVALSPAEFAKLEAGDTAATIDATVTISGAEFGLWTCISPGTVGVGGAVWIRMDTSTASQQTIRDAHRIVVGIAGATTGTPATDILLNLSPYVAGFSADFIDTGNGTGLALAIATAAAIGNPVDVRIVSGVISLESGLISTPLVIPTNCRLIGAGSLLTTILGRDTADQGIFTMGVNSSLENIALKSPVPVSAPGTSVGVVQATGISSGNFSLNDVLIELVDSALRVAKIGVHAIAAGSGGSKSCRLNNVRVSVDGSISSGGISIEGYVLSSIHDCTVIGASTGLRFGSGLGPISGNEAGSIRNFRGYDLQQQGVFIESALGSTPLFGLSISDCYVKLNDADFGTDQYAIFIKCDSLIDQLSVSGFHARWGANAQTVGKVFASVATLSVGSQVVGLKFVNSGATSGSMSTSAGISAGIRLDASDPNSIRGSDLGCDIAGFGLLPSAVIQITASPVLWEHAHPSGLA